MEISSVSSSSKSVAAVQSPTQTSRAREAENDNDKDDGAAKIAQQATPRPTVNTSGQVVGSIIDTQA